MEQLIYFRRRIESLSDEEFVQCIITFGRNEITKMMFKQFVTQYNNKQTNDVIKMNNIINKINESPADDIHNNIDNNNQTTFITLPIDIKIKIYQQFLEEKDIYSLEKTCRDICIEARNPNSIHQIAIDNLSNINKYTQNPRYSKVSYFCFSMWDFDVGPSQMKTILPSINRFHNLSEIAIGLTAFLCANNELNHFLDLFYSMLSNTSNDKTLYFDCDREAFMNDKMSLIFDADHKQEAKTAIISVKHLEIYGWKCCLNNRVLIGILENIIDIYLLIDNNNSSGELLSSITLELNEVKCDLWDENWQLFQKFAIYSKKSKLTLKCGAMDYEYPLIDWFSGILSDGEIWFNEFTIEIDQGKQSDVDAFFRWNWNDCKYILNIWMSKMDNISMKKIGIKTMNVIYIHADMYNDDVLKEQLKLMEADIQNINGLKYDIEEVTGDYHGIELIISYEYNVHSD